MWHSVKVMMPEVLGRYKEIIDEYQMEVFGTKVPSPRWEVCVKRTLRVFAAALARPFVKDVYDSTAKTMVGTSSGKKTRKLSFLLFINFLFNNFYYSSLMNDGEFIKSAMSRKISEAHFMKLAYYLFSVDGDDSCHQKCVQK